MIKKMLENIFVGMVDLIIDFIIEVERMFKNPKRVITFLTFIIMIGIIINTKITSASALNEMQTKYDELYNMHTTLLEEVGDLKEVVVYSQETEQVAEEERLPEKENILDIASSKYGIEAELLEAIERLETGHYTSNLYKVKNNTWGAFDGREYKSFSSKEESTMELARVLREYYINIGLDTIEKIGTKYCPDDPTWAHKVRKIYENLKSGYVYN